MKLSVLLILLSAQPLFAQTWLSGGESLDWVAQEEARSPELRQAADSLRQSGFVPLEPRVLTADSLIGATLLWEWEDFNPELITAIVYAMHKLGGRELTIVQSDRRGNVITQQRQFQRPLAPIRVEPQGDMKVDAPRQPDVYINSLSISTDWESYYGCASAWCGVFGLVSILSSPVTGGAAAVGFFGSCTTAMLTCLQHLLPPPPPPPQQEQPRLRDGELLPGFEEFSL